MSFQLRTIINAGDTGRKGLLSRFDSAGVTTLPTLFRGDGNVLDLRIVQPSATPSVRPFDDVDLTAAIADGGLIVAVGKPGSSPWLYCDTFSAVSITPVDIDTKIAGSAVDPLRNDVQVITLGEGVYGGSYSIALTLPNVVTADGLGTVTRSFTVSALLAAEQLAAALLAHPEAVDDGENGISVTGPVGGPYTVEFIGHLGNRDIAEMTVADVNLLLPLRVQGVLEEQEALQVALDAEGGTAPLSGVFEASLTFPGDAPATILQVPATVKRDLITDGVTSHATAGAFRFLPSVTGYTGGGSTKLDGIATVGKTFGVVAFCHATEGIRMFQLVAGTDAEDSPAIIRPDDFHATTNPYVWKSRL